MENTSEGALRRTGGAYTLLSSKGAALDKLLQISPSAFEGRMYLASSDMESVISDISKPAHQKSVQAPQRMSNNIKVPPPPAGSLIFTQRAYIEPSHLRLFKEHQIEGVQFMFHRLRSSNGALLADEMGLGKTFQAVAIARIFCRAGGRVLIASPCSLVGVWEKEIKKWAESLRIFNGTRTNPNKYMGVEHVLLVSYEKLCTLKTPNLFQLIICDEAHRLRTSTSNAVQALKKMEGKKLLLTGTPFQNTLQEYRTLLALVDNRAEGAKNIKELAGIAGDAVLRRSVERASVKLPQKDELIWIIRNEEYTEKSEEAVGTIQEIQRLRNRASTSVSKWKVFCQLALSILKEGHSLVIISRYVEIIRKALREVKKLISGSGISMRPSDVVLFHGEMSVREREAALDEFQGRGQKVIVLSAKCGAEGLTLVKACRMIILDSDWNPANDLQAMARIWRIGQKSPVVVHRLFLMGSIEEYILLVQMRKMEVRKQVEGEGEEEDILEYTGDSIFKMERDSIVHRWLQCSCTEESPLEVTEGYSHRHTSLGLILSQRTGEKR